MCCYLLETLMIRYVVYICNEVLQLSYYKKKYKLIESKKIKYSTMPNEKQI